MTYNVTVFELFLGFVKISDHIVIASEEFELLYDPSTMGNTTSNTVHYYNLHAYVLLHYDWHVICM